MPEEAHAQSEWCSHVKLRTTPRGMLWRFWCHQCQHRTGAQCGKARTFDHPDPEYCLWFTPFPEPTKEERIENLVDCSQPNGPYPEDDFTVPVRAKDMWLLARRIRELEAQIAQRSAEETREG